jgi:hypothetical protein
MSRRDRRLEGFASENRLTALSSRPRAQIRSLAAAHCERWAATVGYVEAAGLQIVALRHEKPLAGIVEVTLGSG